MVTFLPENSGFDLLRAWMLFNVCTNHLGLIVVLYIFVFFTTYEY